HGFRFYFTPLPGCFSPFPHATGSLSVTKEYLALGDGPPRFRRNSSCSAVLRILLVHFTLSCTGLLPPMVTVSIFFHSIFVSHVEVLQPQSKLVWALPTSLAATTGIVFTFSSSGYYDVSVPQVYLSYTNQFIYE